MNAKEEGMILGELKGFKESTLRELGEVKSEMKILNGKVESLTKFKWRATGILAGMMFGAQIFFNAIKTIFEFKSGNH